MHHCLCPHCMYSNAFCNARKRIPKCRLKKSRVNTKCVLRNGQSTLRVAENNMTTVKAIIGPENDLLRELRTGDDYVQSKHAEKCIYDWAKVILVFGDSSRELREKQIVILLLPDDFEQNWIEETLKDVSACI